MKEKSLFSENPEKPKRIGIWIRVSTEDQALGESPKHHEHRAREYAQKWGWEVVEVYDLAGQSGKSVMGHPECQRMMKDIQRGHITVLVFSKLARLSRSLSELDFFSKFFKKHNADMRSLSEEINTASAGGRMFFHLLSVFAQWEREEMVERSHASVLTRAKMGKSINGSAPYGYKWADHKLIIVPAEATVRREAYELFANFRRKGQVAQILNNKGYRTRKGKLWRDSTVLRLLEDPSAKGVYVFNKERFIGKWRTEPKPESEWGYAACEPIVSVELWEQVNQVIQEQLKSWKRPGKPVTHLFSGLAYCHCGIEEQKAHKMYVRLKSAKYFCRKCNNKFPVAKLEIVVCHQLNHFFGQPERVAGHLANGEKQLAEQSNLLETHQRELQRVREEMQKTYRLYLDEQISGGGFKEIYGPLEEQKSQLEAELPKLATKVDALRAKQLSVTDVVQESQSLQERWPYYSFQQKRAVVEALIAKMVVFDGKIEIDFSETPTSVELCKNQQGLRPG